jgi:hypothetical protein
MDNRTTPDALHYNGNERYYLSRLGQKIPVVTPESRSQHRYSS